MPKLIYLAGLIALLPGAVFATEPVKTDSVLAAVRAGNTAALQKALKQHGNANEGDVDGTTALHWAVVGDSAAMVDALLAAGANPNAKNDYGRTPLSIALDHANAPLTAALLKAGADPRAPLPSMGNALMAAARTGNSAVISALLKAGVNVNEPEKISGQTALMWAASEGHVEAVKTLLDGGADVKLKTTDEDLTAMFFAVRKGSIGVVEELLAAGANINDRTESETLTGRDQGQVKVPGDSMVVLAIHNAHFNLADFLLNKGADPNQAGVRWTPLHALSRVRNYEEAQFPPPIARSGEMDSLDLARHLVAKGANVNAQAKTTTAKRPGTDQNYKDIRGATPFFLAAKSGDIPYMRMLLAAGADPSIALDDHTTPLMVAAGIGCVTGQWIEQERDILAAVKLLVEETHADVNAMNDDHETALHGGACRSMDSVIQYLVDKGAKLNVKDADDQTPLELAVQGLVRASTINGPKIATFHTEAHTIALLKKLTEAQGAQAAAH
jgi:ankyrin repeat protein